MVKDARKRALAARPKLPLVEESLRRPTPRTHLVAHSPHWQVSVRDGVAVKGWVFSATVDDTDPHGHDYTYEVAYERDGEVHVFTVVKGVDPWDWARTGPFGEWFMETVMKCKPATVLLHPEREPVLFGDAEPWEVVTLGDQIERAQHASGDRRAKEIGYAIEVLQEAARADGSPVAALLAPFASTYTKRPHDRFYVVADLYAYARAGGDVLSILTQIAPQLPDVQKEYWAAE